MRVERSAIPAVDRAAWEALGWTFVRDQPAHLRPDDVLMERVSVTVAGEFVTLSASSAAHLDAYCAAIGSTRQAVVEGWIAGLAPAAVLVEAVEARK